MLELRPNCEMCDCDLVPQDTQARICSYECTFCAHCAEEHLQNVCPNCGGGFVPRPIRPAQARRTGVSRQHQPASTKRFRLKYDLGSIQVLVAQTKGIAPEDR